jgi:hypothetical protein
VLLSAEQVFLLTEDIDYILPRTGCDTIPLTKSRILREIESDADVLLDLVEGMPEGDARFLSVPLERLRSLILQRRRGVVRAGPEEATSMLMALEE